MAGVDDSPASRAALDLAYAYAAQHRLPVAALHVSDRAPDDAAQLLADTLAPWTKAYPLVPTRCSVLAGSVGEELVQAAGGVRLLVVGDKRRGDIGRACTGDVPLTVATEAPCSVAVVPLAQRDADPW